MKIWHIWDFPDNVYVALKEDFREEFFNKIFEKVGGKRPYARFLGLNQMAVKSYYRGYTHKRGIEHPQTIPVWVFKKSVNLMGEELKEKLENNILLLKAKNKGIPLFNPKLSFKESLAFYRIVAHMIGDGSAPERKVPYYANTCKELREQFKSDLGIFGDMEAYERIPSTTSIICFPKVITDILSHILDVKFTEPDRIPKQIFSASEECKGAFLQALFDDEGTVSTALGFGMSNSSIVNEIKELVESLGIKTSNISLIKNRNWKDHFTFTIKRDSLTEFKEKIGFIHPKKIINLGFSINTKNRTQRTRDINEIESLVITNLNNGSRSTLEIANNLQLTLGHTLKILKNMEGENKIICSGFKNKRIWSLPRA